MLADLNNIKNGVLSNLHLAMNSTVNELFGARLVRSLQCAPTHTTEDEVLPSRQIITAVGSELWELGLGPFQQTMPDRFRTLSLFSETRHLVISKDRLDPSASAEDVLNQVPLIVSHLDDPDLRPTIDKLRDNFGTIWEVNDLSLRLDLLNNGLGMTYLDQRIGDNHPELAVRLFPFTTIPLTYGIYYRRDKLLSAGAHQFISVCRTFQTRD